MKLPLKFSHKHLLIIISSLLIISIASFTGIFLAQKFTPRQSETPPEGSVTLSLSPQTTSLPANQPSNISVFINTNNAQINGVQFKLNISGNATAELIPETVSGLNVLAQNVDNNTITYAAGVDIDTRTPYSTSQATKIATIILTPQDTTDLLFDQSASIIASHTDHSNILFPPINGHYPLSSQLFSSLPFKSQLIILIGIGLTVLIITGIIIWLKKRRQSKLKTKPSQPETPPSPKPKQPEVKA